MQSSSRSGKLSFAEFKATRQAKWDRIKELRLAKARAAAALALARRDAIEARLAHVDAQIKLADAMSAMKQQGTIKNDKAECS